MNLLHLDEQRGWRGGEQQACYLIQGLLEAGHAVHVAGRPESAFLDRCADMPVAGVLPLPFWNEGDMYTAGRLACYVRRHNIDLLHAHTSHTHTLACLAQRLARRGKVVVSRRVDFPPKPGRFNRWKYHAPDRIIAISGCIRDILRAYGLPEAKLRLARSGIDPERFEHATPGALSDFLPEAKQEGPLLGNVAALAPHKDQATLIAAMPTVLKVYPEARLLIAGEGKLRPALEAQIAALGLQDRVHLLGFVHDIPRFLKTLDCFVLSSKEEGLGTSVLDAIACRTPVVATAAGGIPEMIRDGETGLLTPVGDAQALAEALLATLADPDAAARRCEAAHAWMQAEFTVARMVAGNLAVYNELMESES